MGERFTRCGTTLNFQPQGGDENTVKTQAIVFIVQSGKTEVLKNADLDVINNVCRCSVDITLRIFLYLFIFVVLSVCVVYVFFSGPELQHITEANT